MNISGKKVLVTGAGGFIGSHLVEELLKKKCKVKAFVHYNSFNRWGWLDYLPNELKKEISEIRKETGNAPITLEEKFQKASKLYDEAQEALKQGDFALYAAKIEELGRILGRD